MIALKIIGLILCMIVACYSIVKIVQCMLNLKSLSYAKKHPYNVPRTDGIVFNKKTSKLEEDSSQMLPFK